jgi:hypothetical protein
VQNTAFDVASLVHTHGSMTTAYTATKKREDTESHCEGLMSMVCGNVQGGEIVRLDKDLTWHLEPKQQRYREDAFATPEQLAAMRAQMKANLEKMKSCPANTRAQEPVDKSKCEMSPPKFEVRKTGDKGTFAGLSSERTLATYTQSCTDKQTGDVCDTVVAMEMWLTQDSLPGAADRRAFDQAYAKKLGLAEMQGMFSGQMATYLAPYQSQMSELTEKMKQLKGLPLKTTFRVMMGGPQCAAAKKQAADSSLSSGSGSNGNPTADMTDAGKAVGQLLGGLFKKKKNADASSDSGSASSTPPAQIAPPSSTEFPQMTQLVGFTIETTAVQTDAIAAERFEIPAGWTKEVPQSSKTKDEYTCPKSGS